VFLSCLICIDGTTQNVIEKYPNDSLKIKGNLKNGLRDGEWKEWHPNGQLKQQGNYENGKLTGNWVFYCEHGVREREMKWDNDLCYKVTTYHQFDYPYVQIQFPEGISKEEYLDYLRIFLWARKNQLRLLRENSDSSKFFHYQYELITFGPPYVNQSLSGTYEGLTDFYIDSIQVFEIIRNKYLVAYCRKLEKRFIYTEYAGVDIIKTRIKRMSGSDIFRIDQDNYLVEPFDPYISKFFLNDTLIYQYKTMTNGENAQYCTEYYPDRTIQSEGLYDGAYKKGKWKYYNPTGKLVIRESYKKGELIKRSEF